jgi:hypothetical protein
MGGDQPPFSVDVIRTHFGMLLPGVRQVGPAISIACFYLLIRDRNVRMDDHIPLKC